MYKARIKEKLWFSQCGITWSAESQVLIPAEHFCFDFKSRPWAKNSSPNNNDQYIHYMDKSTGTPPSLEEKKALPNCGHKDGNIINVLKKCISTSVATVLKCMKWLHPYVFHFFCIVFPGKIIANIYANGLSMAFLGLASCQNSWLKTSFQKSWPKSYIGFNLISLFLFLFCFVI